MTAAEQARKDSKVQLQIVEGLGHGQVFHEIERVFPVMLAYTGHEPLVHIPPRSK
jgi:hypothetical protein